MHRSGVIVVSSDAPHLIWRILSLFVISAMYCFSLLGCKETNPQSENLPKLLKNVSAASGWYSACPPRNESEKKAMGSTPLAISPDFTQRLIEQFPLGTSDARLIQILTTQGFKLVGHCESDLTIKQASFYQKGKGFLPYDLNAQVYWKLDDKNQIVWTKGFVSYTGL